VNCHRNYHLDCHRKSPGNSHPNDSNKCLNPFGATLRQSAQEISAKAAAQVNYIAKLTQTNDGLANSTKVEAPSLSNTDTSTTASLGTAPRTDSVEKTEVLEMMKKMNQKMKLLSNIRQQLTEKFEKAEKEKLELRNMVVDDILHGCVHIDESKDEIMQLRSAWRQIDEKNSMALQQLQNEFIKFHNDKERRYPQRQRRRR
jgi:hypothetical protein